MRWEIDRIHRALLPIGVRPVFLKGAGYIAAGLLSGVGRVVADVDILVAEVDIPRVEAALKEHGWDFEPLDAYDERYYREWMHELPPMRHQGRGTMLDVHHRILPRTGRIHPPTDTLLALAVEVAGTRVLCPEHMVLHSAAHLFQDGQVAGALRDVLDIRDLLETFGRAPDFERRLTAAAEVLGLGRPLYYAVRYSRMVGLAASYPGVNAWRPSGAGPQPDGWTRDADADASARPSRVLGGPGALHAVALAEDADWPPGATSVSKGPCQVARTREGGRRLAPTAAFCAGCSRASCHLSRSGSPD